MIAVSGGVVNVLRTDVLSVTLLVSSNTPGRLSPNASSSPRKFMAPCAFYTTTSWVQATPSSARSGCLITATKVYVILWDVARRFASNLNVFQVFVCFRTLLCVCSYFSECWFQAL